MTTHLACCAVLFIVLSSWTSDAVEVFSAPPRTDAPTAHAMSATVLTIQLTGNGTFDALVKVVAGVAGVDTAAVVTISWQQTPDKGSLVFVCFLNASSNPRSNLAANFTFGVGRSALAAAGFTLVSIVEQLSLVSEQPATAVKVPSPPSNSAGVKVVVALVCVALLGVGVGSVLYCRRRQRVLHSDDPAVPTKTNSDGVDRVSLPPDDADSVELFPVVTSNPSEERI